MKLSAGMLGLGAAALYMMTRTGTASAASSTATTATLRPGNYRVTFPTAALDAATPLSTLFALPQAWLSGLGGVATFEGLQTSGASWRVTALMQYAGPSKAVTLSPGMTVERL